jgi:hypothetical protein
MLADPLHDDAPARLPLHLAGMALVRGPDRADFAAPTVTGHKNVRPGLKPGARLCRDSGRPH